MDERLLITHCQNGDKVHFTPLVQYYEKDLYRYCYYLCGSEERASDLFQETWLKAMTRIKQYKHSYRFKNWLFSIASNTFKDQYRKNKRWRNKVKDYSDQEQMQAEMENVSAEFDSVTRQVVLQEDQNTVQHALLQLKEHYRLVIVLFYFEELSLEEISQTLHIPKGTVKSRLNQGKKLMKQVLEVSR